MSSSTPPRANSAADLLTSSGIPTVPAGSSAARSETYLKPQQAAAYINSSASTLAKLRLYGGGPKFTRIGRAIRYRKSDLDAFMAAGSAHSTSESAQSKGGRR